MKRKLYVVFSVVMVLCMLALPGLTASACDLPQWTKVNAVPPNETMANVTGLASFNGNLYAGTTRWADVDVVNINSAVYQSKDGKNWKKVSPDGFGDPIHNTTIYGMVVFRDKLYVGTGDYFGGEDPSHGTSQLWRTSNGVNWEAVDTSGFGDPNNFFFSNLTVYRGMLYGAVVNAGMGVQLYHSATGNPGSWKKVTTVFDDPKYVNQHPTGFITFNEMLYLAVENAGVGLWRSKDGMTWTPVTTDGFGDAGNSGTGGFAIYKDQLYWGTGNGAGGQIWRTWDGKNWSKVMDSGFGDANNFKIESLMPYAGDLYAITSNFMTGVEAWRTNNGKKWEQVNQDGFRPGCTIGDGEDCNWGIHNGTSTLVFNNSLFAGTWNSYGGEIWKLEAHR